MLIEIKMEVVNCEFCNPMVRYFSIENINTDKIQTVIINKECIHIFFKDNIFNKKILLEIVDIRKGRNINMYVNESVHLKKLIKILKKRNVKIMFSD
jgi:hypothetical protein